MKNYLQGKKLLLIFSLSFLMLIFLFAIFSQQIAPYSYEIQNIKHALEGPSNAHWLGTDSLGRDLLSRVIYGARISLTISVLSTFLSVGMGLLFGLITGYFGGWIDRILRRWLDLFSTMPSLLIAMLLTLRLGRDFFGILITISMISWTPFAWLVRGLVLKIKNLPYIEGASSMGSSSTRILFTHILPHLLNPLLLSITLHIPNIIMLESFLSFIGLGLSPPLTSWGSLAREGFQTVHSYPHLTYVPSIALFFTIFSLNVLGNHLRNKLTRN